MTWWCSASSAPWTWAWRPYPGVWLFIIALAVGYWRWGRARSGSSAAGRLPFIAGSALLWVALDWPLGTLAGYLASAHALQFILLALGAPPLLLAGLRPRLAEIAEAGGTGRRILRFLCHPLTGLAGFNVILLGSHVPGVVDALMPSQIGSLGIDLAWIAAGALLWLPAQGPAAALRLSPPLAIAYLFVQTIPSTVPAAFLIFSDFPLFKLYELAPRVTDLLTPANDHQVAGLLMKTVGDPVIWIGMAVVFFRWANVEKRADRAARGLPKVASRA